MKFRKKPIEIEAVQFDGTWESAQFIYADTYCIRRWGRIREYIFVQFVV